MSHWIILPLILPPVVAAVIMLAARHLIGLARILSLSTTLALLALDSLSRMAHRRGERPSPHAMDVDPSRAPARGGH